MKIISTIILLFFVAIPIVFGFGGQTKMRIDEIYNNTGDNIILKPSNKVGIDYLTGDKIIQSTSEGLLEESTVTTTELGYLSGVTSSIQTQIGSKQDSITGTDGDLYYWNSGLSNLTIGTEGQFLKVSSLGFPEWVDLPTAVSVTTKGDLQTYSTQADRLPVGTDGQVLQANSATSTGLEWVDADFYTSPLTTEGDLLYRDATQDTRLPIGTEDQVLTVNASGLPVWADSKGGGGSAGINFVFDPSFEKGDLNPDTDASAVESYQLYTADDKLYAEFNEQYYRAAYTGLTANNTYVRDTFARTDLDGKQGLFSIWIKANAENFELCLRTDDSGFASACDDAYKLNILGDNTWRKYEIPFVYGAASVEYEIKNASYTGDVTIELDNIYVGTMPDGYISKIDTTITDWVEFTPTGSWSGAVSYTGKYRRVGDSAEIRYKVITSGLPTGTDLQLDLPSNLSIDLTKLPNSPTYPIEAVGTGIIADPGVSSYVGIIQYTDTLGTFRVLYDLASSSSLGLVTPTTPITFGSGDYISVLVKIPIKGWSTDYSTVVTQDTELTTKTANEFSAYVSSAGNLLRTNYDWLTCVPSTSPFTCNFNSGIFTVTPSCVVSTNESSGTRVATITTLSTSLITVKTYNSATGSGSSVPFIIHCSKQGADVNKSATIVGKFENINSSELSVVYGNETSYTANVNNGQYFTFNEQEDNNNIWSGSLLTAQRDACFKISGRARFATSTAYLIGLHKNSGGTTLSSQIISNYQGSANARMFDQQVCLSKGDTWGLTPNVSITQENIGSHFINITETATTQSIIKNLSNQKVECQTKTLSGDVTTTGLISDWQFNNLEIGKKYSIEVNYHCYESNTSVNSKHCVVEVESPTKDFIDWHEIAVNTSANMRSTVYGKKDIIAENEILRFNVYTLNNANIKASSSGKISTVKLCELPDTYVETTKF